MDRAQLTSSSATAAVVIKVEGAMLRIMDQNGAVRVVTPHEVTARRDNKNFAVAVAQDSNGNDMKVGDAMKEVGGEVSCLKQGCPTTDTPESIR
jgi:transcription elongation factor SPT5